MGIVRTPASCACGVDGDMDAESWVPNQPSGKESYDNCLVSLLGSSSKAYVFPGLFPPKVQSGLYLAAQEC